MHLQIRENIALGDPGHSDDLERIVEAATLGGASGFIDKLSDGYDTYLDRPVMDHYSGLPEGTTDLFGRPVSFARIRGMGDMKSNGSSSLSGGQMQRIALYVWSTVLLLLVIIIRSQVTNIYAFFDI